MNTRPPSSDADVAEAQETLNALGGSYNDIRAGCYEWKASPHPTLLRRFFYDPTGRVYKTRCLDCGHEHYRKPVST